MRMSNLEFLANDVHSSLELALANVEVADVKQSLKDETRTILKEMLEKSNRWQELVELM